MFSVPALPPHPRSVLRLRDAAEVVRKPAAVEAGSICTAELVRRADERGCERGDRIPRGGARRLTRRADTTGKCNSVASTAPARTGAARIYRALAGAFDWLSGRVRGAVRRARAWIPSYV